MPEHHAALRPTFDPIADPAAVIVEGNARFTVLTSRLIRMEYAGNGRFEDRPSQPFWYRRQPVPDYTIDQTAEGLTLRTEHLELHFLDRGAGFQPDTLSVHRLGTDSTWHYGDPDEGNLLGTTRTLDTVNGSTHLEPGLLSRLGWVVVDDSATLVFNETGWLATRDAAEGTQDLYFFGYGRDFRDCLQDYARVAGKTPLLPRWVLGNWWSRYWDYSAEDLKELIEDFRYHDVPLAVCIVDMDWHLVDVGPGINGWTGYTWNRTLFPNPSAFVDWLHGQGLRTALNLHPALGIRSYEEAYPQMARRLDIDPDSQDTIPFDIASPEFAKAYFEELHHPLEADGVDFWWLDWQQGEQTSLVGLDPLWWLNHLHFYDLGREGKRPFTFSRWGGLGNHRYPIGFSGDTHVDWETLAFQPYFTATAANVGYGWWSHDIGGHMQGIEDRELYTRWVQFGVFSPVFRLHSTKNPYHERRPWGYDDEVYRITRDAMQLRHALIPYLYTQSWLNETTDVAPVRPLYHDYPERDEAYTCPQAYFFGDDLIVAPYTSPADFSTRLARQVVWLPPGDWYDFFTGQHFAGDAWYALHGRLDEIPVFARSGAIIPLAPRVGWGGVDVPDELDIFCYAGADGRFTLFEDSGESLDYRQGAYALSQLEQQWTGDQLVVTMQAPQGDSRFVPEERRVRIHVVGVRASARVVARIGDEPLNVTATYDKDRETLSVIEIVVPRGKSLQVRVQRDSKETLLARRDRTLDGALRMLESFRMESLAKATLALQLADFPRNPSLLTAFETMMTPAQSRALLETMLGAGGHVVSGTADPHLIVLWNNLSRDDVAYTYSLVNEDKWTAGERYHGEAGPLPRFLAISPETELWRAAVSYGGSYVFPLGGDAV